MNRRSVFCVVVSLLSLSILFASPSFAQTVLALDKIQNQQELDSAITALDAALFDAYNRCDLEKFASFIDENVEFYHDQGGVTLGKVALTDSVKKNICGKVTRELVPGSLKVYHMKVTALSRWAFTASIIPATKIPKGSAKASSFTSGSTKTAHGKSPA